MTQTGRSGRAGVLAILLLSACGAAEPSSQKELSSPPSKSLCQPSDAHALHRTVMAVHAAEAAGYDVSHPVDVYEGCSLDLENHRCIFFVTERVPNTACPEEFPEAEKNVVVCFRDDMSVARVGESQTECLGVY